MGSFAPILRPNPSIVLNTDAPLAEWGASMAGAKTGRLYSTDESQQHINILELKAALSGLKALCSNFHNNHILIQTDNRSSVTAINKMGSTRSIDLGQVVHLICSCYRTVSCVIWNTFSKFLIFCNLYEDNNSKI